MVRSPSAETVGTAAPLDLERGMEGRRAVRGRDVIFDDVLDLLCRRAACVSISASTSFDNSEGKGSVREGLTFIRLYDLADVVEQ